MPNFRLLGSIIKKKYPKVADPLKRTMFRTSEAWQSFQQSTDGQNLSPKKIAISLQKFIWYYFVLVATDSNFWYFDYLYSYLGRIIHLKENPFFTTLVKIIIFIFAEKVSSKFYKVHSRASILARLPYQKNILKICWHAFKGK